MTSKLALTLFTTTLLSLCNGQVGQNPSGYLHTQELRNQLKQVEASLPFLATISDDLDALKDVFAKPKEIFRYISLKSNGVSSTCINQTLFLLETLASANQSKTWALKMVDAWAKPEPGILEFHLQWLGNFDECVDVQSVKPATPSSFAPADFIGKYCAISTTLGSLSLSFGLSASLSVGGCFPSGCSEDDITNVIGSLTEPLNINSTVTVACQETDMPLSDGAIICIVVYSFMGALCLLGTLYDFCCIMTTPDRAEECQKGGVPGKANDDVTGSRVGDAGASSYDLCEMKSNDTAALAQTQDSPAKKKTNE